MQATIEQPKVIASTRTTELMWEWRPGVETGINEMTFLTPRIEDEAATEYRKYYNEERYFTLDVQHLETVDVTDRYPFIAKKWRDSDFRVIDSFQKRNEEIPIESLEQMFHHNGGEYRVYLMRFLRTNPKPRK